jgi:hypothetical protein
MINKKTGLTVLLASFAAGELMAGTLSNYASGDVLLCFRNGSSDLVVDVGQLSTLTNLTANARYTISTYTTAQLTTVGTGGNNPVGLNGTSWSAFSWTPDNTLFVTRPRATTGTPTLPWYDAGSQAQNGAAIRMANVPTGATNNLAYDANNTSTAILEPDSSSTYFTGLSYHTAEAGSYGGNFNGTFQGNPENTTPGSFSTGGTVQQSDFYQMTPNNGFIRGKYLGYFELNTNGVMTYVAYPSTTPVIQSISRSGNQTTINYTTGLYGTYTLRSNTSLTSGTPLLSWASVATLSTGDTATHAITFTDNNAASFYTITAQ